MGIHFLVQGFDEIDPRTTLGTTMGSQMGATLKQVSIESDCRSRSFYSACWWAWVAPQSLSGKGMPNYAEVERLKSTVSRPRPQWTADMVCWTNPWWPQLDSNCVKAEILSWIQFNYRVLDQVHQWGAERIWSVKFLAITASNLDEFCTIPLRQFVQLSWFCKGTVNLRHARLNHSDQLLLSQIQNLYLISMICTDKLETHSFIKVCKFARMNHSSPDDTQKVDQYFKRTIYPMPRPWCFDGNHVFQRLRIIGCCLVWSRLQAPTIILKPKACFTFHPKTNL